MQLTKNFFSKMLRLLVFGGVAWAWGITQAQAGWFTNEKINVNLKVQDEAGRPIPFVTVWQFVKFDPTHTNGSDISLTMEDLWRCTVRYQDTFEYVVEHGDKPVRSILVPRMGNQQGEVRHVLDYEEITGRSNRYSRPAPLAFGYTLMKRGYEPGKVEFLLHKDAKNADAMLTLKRDLSQEIEDRPYLQMYDRIRYELSDTQLNTALNLENNRRIAALCKGLEQAAQMAIAADDNRAAARIYARMRYLPELTIVNNRVAGFSQTNPSSAQSEQMLQRALELDPENLFVWMHTIQKRTNNHMTISPKARTIQNIAELEALIEKHGAAAWPEIFRWRAGSYANLGDFATARNRYLEAARLEPKFTDWNERIEDMKRAMRMKNIPVPSDW